MQELLGCVDAFMVMPYNIIGVTTFASLENYFIAFII